MNSITIKNLWAHKKQNVWIFAELIVLTFVTWVVIEPVIKDTYRRMLPRGYQPERMVIAEVTYQDPSLRKSPDYYIERIKALPGVETATAISNNYGEYAGALANMMMGCVNGDTVAFNLTRCSYDLDYFNTHGMLNIKGDKVGTPDKDKIVVTRSFAEEYLGGLDVIGKEVRLNSFELIMDEPNWDYSKILSPEYAKSLVIADVIEDVRFCAASGPNHSASMKVFANLYGFDKIYNRILIRLDKDVDLHAFMDEHRREIENIVKADDDNALLVNMDTAEEYNKMAEDERHLVQPIRTRKVLVVFLLFNLVLGIIGTFWLNAKRRSEEMGIVMAFGAKRRNVTWSYLKDGWVMFTIAFVIAACIFFNYAINTTAAKEIQNVLTIVDRFWPAFILDSVIVYAIMIIVVSLGIVIPTVKMSKTKVIDLLNKQ